MGEDTCTDAVTEPLSARALSSWTGTSGFKHARPHSHCHEGPRMCLVKFDCNELSIHCLIPPHFTKCASAKLSRE
eukprot:286375-Amphidinium_carterae.2